MKQEKAPSREIIILSASVFLLAAGLVWVRALTVKASYQFVSQERRFRQIESEAQALRVKWLKMTSPKRLELLAGNIGLEPPKLSQNLKVQAGSSARKKF